jgi:hypothetical protein
MFKARDFRDAEMHVPLSQLLDNVALCPSFEVIVANAHQQERKGTVENNLREGAAATPRAADLAGCCSKPLGLVERKYRISLSGAGYAPILRMKKFDS